MKTYDAIITRRSTRKFKSQPVDEAALNAIIEAGRYAPSGGNNQKCHFTVVTNQTVLTEIVRLGNNYFKQLSYDEHTYPSLVSNIKKSQSGHNEFLYGAPVLIIVTNEKDYGNNLADSACAIENMMVMANELDMGSCWINQLHWMNEDNALREYLAGYGIDKAETITGSVAIGYADTVDGMPVRTPIKRTGNIVDWVR